MFLSTFFKGLARNNFTNTIRIVQNSIFPHSVVPPSRLFYLGAIYRSEQLEDDTENIRDASKDRTKVIPVETSIRYLQSSAYAQTYGDQPVWKLYRRNHKGAIAPLKTRKTCIRKGKISTGNPCPICRDEYLVLKPENVELLRQFISPYTGETLSYSVTGVCQKKHRELLVALEIAKDRGLIEFDIPFREYDYTDYKCN